MLLALAGSARATPIELPWSLAIRARVNAVAADGTRAYLATGDNRAELVVVDPRSGAVLGRFDAPGGADALSVHALAPGTVKLARRRSDAPEIYRLDVRDPASIVVLDAQERPRSVRWQPDPIPPVLFPDANGDGVYRLACLGDSNTFVAPGSSVPKWCELLAGMIDAEAFEVVNLAQPGATVCPNLVFASDAAQQLDEALAHAPDAVVLAFGTNDRFQNRPTDVVLAAYLAQAEAAEAAGLAVYVATTPPLGGCTGAACPRIYWANILLALTFPEAIVDFFGGFASQHFAPHDQIHLNADGQRLRAERALAAIGSPLRHLKARGSLPPSDATRLAPR
jgi:lysophospholipase L1-like esterase